jgi:hypothetical protein
MARKKGRMVVIDADVARSAGETENQISRSCRNFLKLILENSHIIVTTDRLNAEWEMHQSNYFRKWKVIMVSRKLFKKIIIDENDGFEDNITALNLIKNKEDIALKDIHLIEAAIKAENFIASRDDTARNVFCEISDLLRVIRKIVWMNPVAIKNDQIEWLKAGRSKKPNQNWCLIN